MENSNTLLLTGLPRAGTTLSCNILNSHSNVLALHEPMVPARFNPEAGRVAAVDYIQQFVSETRAQVMREGCAVSQLKDGQVPENPVASGEAGQRLRQPQTSLGLLDVSERNLQEDFTLVVKHNALFTALLPELQESFSVFAIVRNPLAVLASWNSVALPINQGYIPAGEMFAPDLRHQLVQTPDVVTRQLHILEWFCANFVSHLSGRLLRYEDFVADPRTVGRSLGLPTPYAGDIQARQSRNQGYDIALMELLYQRLIGFGDAIWVLYSRDQVTELIEGIRSAA